MKKHSNPLDYLIQICKDSREKPDLFLVMNAKDELDKLKKKIEDCEKNKN
jgi:hypothetical protein